CEADREPRVCGQIKTRAPEDESGLGSRCQTMLAWVEGDRPGQHIAGRDPPCRGCGGQGGAQRDRCCGGKRYCSNVGQYNSKAMLRCAKGVFKTTSSD